MHGKNYKNSTMVSSFCALSIKHRHTFWLYILWMTTPDCDSSPMCYHTMCATETAQILKLNWTVFYSSVASVIKLVSVDNLPESKVNRINTLNTIRFFSSFFFRPCHVTYEMWDLSPLTRDWTQGLRQWELGVLTTGLPGNSPQILSLEKVSRKSLYHAKLSMVMIYWDQATKILNTQKWQTQWRLTKRAYKWHPL